MGKKRGKLSMHLPAKISNSPVDWLILKPFIEVRHNGCDELAYQIARNKQCLTKNFNYSCILAELTNERRHKQTKDANSLTVVVDRVRFKGIIENFIVF